MHTNAMRCYRPNGTCYAILTPSEWTALRNAGKLDAELKRRRDSGVVLEVKTLTGTITPRHISPRVEAEEAARIRAEAEAAQTAFEAETQREMEARLPMVPIQWTGLRYPCDDPENGPARKNPVNGCVECGTKEADSYTDEGVCNTCHDEPKLAEAVQAMREDIAAGGSFENALEHYAALFEIDAGDLRHEWNLRTEDGR